MKNKEFEFEHIPELPMRQWTNPRWEKEYRKIEKKLAEKYPYAIGIYGDCHRPHMTLWGRFKMWLKMQKFKRM